MNKKIIKDYIKILQECEGGADGEVGLNEFLYEMYGDVWDGEDEEVIETFKNDMFMQYGVKVDVSLDYESVYLID